MIVSASRRTDIPAFFADWFFNRLKAGFVYVRNPYNYHAVSAIELTPKTLDGIVFWTKNPAPMLSRLHELEPYPYYFTFTLTPYGKDAERYVPDKAETMVPVFKELSHRIGSERVVWRYDPILFNDRYTESWQLDAFARYCRKLEGCTRQCIIGYLDHYQSAVRNMDIRAAADLQKSFEPESKQKRERVTAHTVDVEREVCFALQLQKIAAEYGILLAACCESEQLTRAGIPQARCLDADLLGKIGGIPLKGKKDKKQRPECLCSESIDIGAYHTCVNGCVYCYANRNERAARQALSNYDPSAPLLCSTLQEGDIVTQRKVQTLRDGQLSLF